jgi:hypothetical protein
MNNEIWHQLLSIESRDIASKWFDEIHSRELNARRAKEINSAAKQAREYFRNAANSNYSVRPLLTFYGVASLSRSLLLLLKRNGGEEGLTGSHGLETVNWGTVMSGEVVNGLKNLGSLKIRTRNGLFSDFATQTNNRISIHINTSGVDCNVCYDVPESGVELTVHDLFSRIPDLQKDFSNISNSLKYTPVNEMTYSDDKGFRAKIGKKQFNAFRGYYESAGYSAVDKADWVILTADAEIFKKNIPLFIHSYIHKTFGSIPTLYISEPFQKDSRYSQLCITYMVAYVLGMLVRYYPTHWISLTQGDKGDEWWPTINRAQQFVEQSFPELVIELIGDVIKEAKNNRGKKNEKEA